MAKWSHSNFGLWSLQHHDRSLPLYKPSPTRSQPPNKRPVPPGHTSLRLAQLAASGASSGEGEHNGPEESRSPREHSAGVRGTFHRERGGEPKARSTGRRACTGRQRQSYKQVGYLTRSSGWVSRGLGGTATEPHSSSWRDQRCSLEGRESGAAAAGAPGGGPHPLQAQWLSSQASRRGGNGRAPLLCVPFKALPQESRTRFLPFCLPIILCSTQSLTVPPGRPCHLLLFHPMHPTKFPGFSSHDLSP